MKQTVAILFIFLTMNLIGATDIINANGKSMVVYNNDLGKITAYTEDLCTKKQSLKEIELGLVVNGKIVKLKEMKPTVNYLKGTGVIEINGDYDKIHLTAHVFTPIETKEKILSIVYDITSMDMKERADVKGFYYINSTYAESEIYYDENGNKATEKNISIRSISSKLNVYITDDENIKSLKFRKIIESEKKRTDEKVMCLVDIGKIDSYDKKGDGLVISLDDSSPNIEGDYKSVIEKEIDNWNYMNRTMSLEGFTEGEKERVVQNIVVLKMLQRKSGSIFNELGSTQEYEIKSREMLYSALAFIKTENFSDAKAVIDFFMNKEHVRQIKQFDGKYSVASYGYECIDESEKIKTTNEGDIVSGYNSALLLYVISEYFNKSGDYTLLRDNYIKLTEQVSDVVYDRVKNGIFEKDSSDREVGINAASNYLLSQYMAYIALSRFSDQVKFFAPKGLVDKYVEAAGKIQEQTRKMYITEKGIICDIPNGNSPAISNAESIIPDFFTDKKVIENTINEFYSKYKVANGDGFADSKDSTAEKVVYTLNMCNILYKNGMKYKSEEQSSRIEAVMKDNYNIVPYEIRYGDGKPKPYYRGLNAELAAKYIINVVEKYRN